MNVVIDKGLCINERCSGAARVDPVERYSGPGQYCPDCGELLAGVADNIAPPPRLHDVPVRQSRSRRPIVVIAGTLVVLIALAWSALIGTRFISALGVRVCTSTMTDGVAKELVRIYSAHGTWPFHYDVTRPGNLACDVRFSVASNGNDKSLLARDGVVAVVNPQNTIAQLDISQLRDILAGRIVNWSQVGAKPGVIDVAVPDDSSDEAHFIASRVMRGAAIGPHIVRSLRASQIAGLVSSPSGRGWIGVVPFSAALPAKVLALGKSPPSTLSIADGRYSMSARIMAESDFRHPSPPTAGLIAFAHSAAAEDVFARAGETAKNAP